MQDLNYLRDEVRRHATSGSEDLATITMISAMYGSSTEYLRQMSRTGVFADHIFMQMCASVLRHDIQIVFVHQVPDPFLRLPGGKFGTEEPGENPPIYVAYFSEHVFRSGHYQAIRPLSLGNN